MHNINKKTKIAFLEGKKTILRLIKKEDINERYLSWINDQEVNRYMQTGIFPTTLRQLKSFYDRISASKTDIMLAVIIKKNKLHIGNVKLGNIDWIHRFADLGIMIGEKEYWGKGYGREACRLLLEYAFKRLNLNKVILGVYATHKSAIKAYQKAGFQIEGRLKKMLILNGVYTDKIIMGILKTDFLKNISELWKE